MKNFAKWSLVAMSICSIAALPTSCKRDNLAKEPDAPPCQIKKLIVTHQDPLVALRSGEFAYNAAGDPITYTPQGYSTGSVKYEFRYDSKGRLSDYIGYYPAINGTGGPFEFWTRYIYDDKGRIIRDTCYHYGTYGPMLALNPAYHVKTLTEYEYDQEQRVSRTVRRQLLNGVPIVGNVADYKFIYNDEGNLIVPGANYDDKVSPFRLNKVWMFLSRNYSKNNIVPAASYNALGLPTQFTNPISGSIPQLDLLYFLGLNGSQIEYQCK